MLLETPGIGWKTLAAVLRRNAVTRRTPEEFLQLPPSALAEEYGIRRPAAGVLQGRIRAGAEPAMELTRWLSKNGVGVVTLLDATYPRELAERLDEPPPALFLYGSPSLLGVSRFAVANSNGAPEEALSAADAAVETAIESGLVLVTGHNRAAYQRPALAARRNGGRVIYVLDRGLRHGFGGDLSRALFPAARIWGPSFDPACDLAISPFPLRAQGIAANNRRRDSVVFALADRLLAGYVRPGGQMEAECRAALGRGQRVLLHKSAAETVGAEKADLRDRDAVRGFLGIGV